jgi:hypothetical protein
MRVRCDEHNVMTKCEDRLAICASRGRIWLKFHCCLPRLSFCDVTHGVGRAGVLCLIPVDGMSLAAGGS